MCRLSNSFDGSQPGTANHGGFGRWAFVEITDPWDAKNTVRAMLCGENAGGVSPLFRQAANGRI